MVARAAVLFLLLLALAANAAAADLKCEHVKTKANGAAVRYLGATPDVKSKVCVVESVAESVVTGVSV